MEQKTSPASLKVLVIISDGESDRGTKAIKEPLDQLDALNVSRYAVGVCIPPVSFCFHTFVSVNGLALIGFIMSIQLRLVSW